MRDLKGYSRRIYWKDYVRGWSGSRTMLKRMDPRVRLSGFKSQLHHLTSCMFFSSYLTSLCLLLYFNNTTKCYLIHFSQPSSYEVDKTGKYPFDLWGNQRSEDICPRIGSELGASEDWQSDLAAAKVGLSLTHYLPYLKRFAPPWLLREGNTSRVVFLVGSILKQAGRAGIFPEMSAFDIPCFISLPK